MPNRKLNQQQKQLLEDWAQQYPEVIDVLDPGCKQLLAKLEEISDYETMWMDANRFLSDILAKRRAKETW